MLRCEVRDANRVRKSEVQGLRIDLEGQQIEFGSLKSKRIEFEGRSFESKSLHLWATIPERVWCAFVYVSVTEKQCVPRWEGPRDAPVLCSSCAVYRAVIP